MDKKSNFQLIISNRIQKELARKKSENFQLLRLFALHATLSIWQVGE